MAFNHLYCLITMEKSSSTNKSKNSFHSLVHVLLFHKFFTWVNIIHSFWSRFWYCSSSKLESVNSKISEEKSQASEFYQRKSSFNERKDVDGSLSREEVEILMEELALFCSPKSEELPQRLSSGELSRLFEEKEPSLEEVKEAFDVFDENKDGFIDAMELKRILCILGLKEEIETDNCRKMIERFDQDGDGRIDFKEFVKFMENCFC